MLDRLLDTLEKLRGLPVLVGVTLVVLNFVVRLVAYALGATAGEPGFLVFLFTEGNLFLHLGIITGLVGVLLGDII